MTFTTSQVFPNGPADSSARAELGEWVDSSAQRETDKETIR
jgi:hypothetical protein